MGHSRILASPSGTATPRGEDETLAPTPLSDQVTQVDNVSTILASLDKLERKRSFGKAALAHPGAGLHAPTQPAGPPKEHTERGRVKTDVYAEYVKAASIPGFVIFLLAIVLQQASQVLANVTLKQWAEHNQQVGSNKGMSVYLILYGLCSLATCLASMVGAITLFVFCTLRSAEYLHDSVSLHRFLSKLKFTAALFRRCYLPSCVLH